MNFSSFLLWGMGVAIVVWASIRSADDIRRRRKMGGNGGDGSGAGGNRGADPEEPPVSML